MSHTDPARTSGWKEDLAKSSMESILLPCKSTVRVEVRVAVYMETMRVMKTHQNPKTTRADVFLGCFSIPDDAERQRNGVIEVSCEVNTLLKQTS